MKLLKHWGFISCIAFLKEHNSETFSLAKDICALYVITFTHNCHMHPVCDYFHSQLPHALCMWLPSLTTTMCTLYVITTHNSHMHSVITFTHNGCMHSVCAYLHSQWPNALSLWSPSLTMAMCTLHVHNFTHNGKMHSVYDYLCSQQAACTLRLPLLKTGCMHSVWDFHQLTAHFFIWF